MSPSVHSRKPYAGGWLLAAVALLFVCAGCRLDMHVQPRYNPYDPTDFFGDGQSARLPVAGHRSSRRSDAWPGRIAVHRESEWPAGGSVSVSRHQGDPRARPRALQHFLLAVPRIWRRWRRHDRAARLPPPAVVSRRPAAHGASGAFFRRDHQRFRRDVSLRLPRAAARPLGHHCLHSGAAAQPAGADRRSAGSGARKIDRAKRNERNAETTR